MPRLLQYHNICALLCLCSGAVLAGEVTVTPGSGLFNTATVLPARNVRPVGYPCVQAVPNVGLNLQDVVNLALCNNPQTREVWANSRSYAAQLEVSRAAYFPGVAVNAAANSNQSGGAAAVDQRSATLSLSYLLYDFGLRAANLESARLLLLAASATRDSTIQAVFLSAVQSYYRVQAADADLEAAIEAELSARESFAAAEARYNAGSATPADKLQARTAYSQAVLNRITAEGELKITQGSLASMVGQDANRFVPLVSADMDTPHESFERDIDGLIAEAQQLRPDLRAAAAQALAAQVNVDAARAADKPTLSLSASASQSNGAGYADRGSSIGINLKVPIFSGYAPTYRIRAAEAQAEVKSIQLERLRLQVALDVWTAYQNLSTATQSLRSSDDLLSSAEQSERVVLGRYKAGVGSMLEVLNAQSTLAGARRQRIQSIYNWNVSRATLAQTMGNLDENLLPILSDTNNKPDDTQQ